MRTNDDNLRNFINDQENIEKESRNDDIGDKVLGIVWKENEDNLEIDIKSYFEKALTVVPTKRNVLKIIAGIYDPLGFIQPGTVRYKIFFQEICTANYNWDDILDENFEKNWNFMIDEIQKIPKLQIRRTYCMGKLEDSVEYTERQMHQKWLSVL